MMSAIHDCPKPLDSRQLNIFREPRKDGRFCPCLAGTIPQQFGPLAVRPHLGNQGGCRLLIRMGNSFHLRREGQAYQGVSSDSELRQFFCQWPNQAASPLTMIWGYSGAGGAALECSSRTNGTLMRGLESIPNKF